MLTMALPLYRKFSVAKSLAIGAGDSRTNVLDGLGVTVDPLTIWRMPMDVVEFGASVGVETGTVAVASPLPMTGGPSSISVTNHVTGFETVFAALSEMNWSRTNFVKPHLL
jgi:hypothetical protein